MNTNFLFSSVICFFISFQNLQAHHKTINVTFVSPNIKIHKFWGLVYSFAKASSQDLNINLQIIYTKDGNHYTYLPSFESAFIQNNKPDLVIGAFFKSRVFDTLEVSKKYDIPIFMINTGIHKDERDSDYIRKKYSTFIGHMYPNEEYAGYILAKHLISLKKKKNPNIKIRVVGITGHRNSPVTHHRNFGLQKAVKEEGAILEQIVYANWSGDVAYNMASRSLSRYKDLAVIWTASDKMAINANKSIIMNNRQDSVVSGGLDWTKDAIDKIKNKELEVSVGGHYSELGFALVLIHDYFHGRDFYDELGGEITTKMSLLTRENIDKYYKFLIKQDWDKIDFSKFSKVLNPEIKKYNFSFDELIKNYKMAQ